MMYGLFTMGFILCWILAGGVACFLITGSVVHGIAAALTIAGFSFAGVALLLWIEDWRDRE